VIKGRQDKSDRNRGKLRGVRAYLRYPTGVATEVGALTFWTMFHCSSLGAVEGKRFPNTRKNFGVIPRNDIIAASC
jgi:hypothetical protein